MEQEATKAALTMPDCVNELIGHKLSQVEECICTLLKSKNPLLTRIGSYICCSGGKRIRPIFLLLAAQVSGYEGDRDVFLASIIECIHAATLLHDDVVDHAAFRRKSPSANKLWGNQLPVLVGDYLYAKSFYWLVDDGDYAVMSTVSSATANVTDGEIFQLHKTGVADLSEEEYMYIITNKTASLIAACCRIGGILGGLSSAMVETLELFGTQVGIAFQLVDDVLDFLSHEEKLGKPTGNDLRSGNATLPLIRTLSLVGKEDRARVREYMKEPPMNRTNLEWTLNLVREHRGAEYTLERARQYIRNIKKALVDFEDCAAKTALLSVADYIVERDF
ncbi:MAG: polyprenyl synthetase family protein [bacterium]